ncbi:S1C family serine protease [Nonomuraea sp. NPDC050328]|uniref:S1C family serine protease n=1 Tax=Nonomuraea sp. NPDC050328 TaxID=3364361 RepID=UPI00379E995D
MNANEPREPGNEDRTEQLPAAGGGWTQFGATPPAAGGFGRTDSTTPAGPAGPPPAGPPRTPGFAAPPAADTLIQPRPGAAFGQQPPFGADQPKPKRAAFSAGQKAIAGLALAAMALGGGAAGAAIATSTVTANRPAAESPVFKQASTSLTVADVAQKVQPSVVTIEGRTGSGSGVVLSADGLILTNNHVVQGAGGDGMTVKFSDGKTAKATVVGTDPSTDIAVIRAADVSGLQPAALGDSDKLRVGDPVLAIGSPLGLDGSVSAGIVSAKDRTFSVGDDAPQEQFPWGNPQQSQQQSSRTTIAGAIQTDAAINSGNSGGALVNAAGQVIGINTAIATAGSNGNIGVGFAVPINTAKKVADELITSGKVKHAYLGVSVTDATGDVPGALIRQVLKDSPAAEAGLQEGDLITKIGDKPVQDGDTVVGAVRGFKVGEKVKITYMRDGQSHDVEVTLKEKTQ